MFHKLIQRATPLEQFRNVMAAMIAISMCLNPTVSTSQVQLVRDINTQIGNGVSTSYSNFVSAGDYFYFVVEGNELWRVPLTGRTASMVKKLDRIYLLTQYKGILYFAGSTEDKGTELWKSGGTASTTVLVKDIRPGPEGSDPWSFIVLENQLFFTANDGRTGRELWKTDGTTSGTAIVKDILAVSGSSNPRELTASNGWLYFVANDGKTGIELWKSNGTPTGTLQVKDIRSEYKVSSDPKELTAVNGTLFFTALKATGQRRLYKSNGTSAGTQLVSDVVSAPDMLTNVNGVLFFAGYDAAHGQELWKSDGTSAGTVLVKDITPGPTSAGGPELDHLSFFTSGGSKLYFLAVGPKDGGLGVWVSDGTNEGTSEIISVGQIYLTWMDPGLTYFNGHLYFISMSITGDDNMVMYRTDGTPDGEEVFIEQFDSYYWYNPYFTVIGDWMYVARKGNVWRTDGTNVTLIRTPYTFTAGSNPTQLTDVNGTLYFSAHDGLYDGLWKSNGTKTGTVMVKHFAAPLEQITKSGNYLYYISHNADTWYNLWRTDLTTGTTRMLTKLDPNNEHIKEIIDVAGTLYISLMSNHQPQLWKSAGSPESTVLVKQFNSRDVPISNMTAMGTTVIFSTSDDNGATDALWRSDGTASTTIRLKTLKTNAAAQRAVTETLGIGQKVYFVGYDGSDYEVWRTDGTSSGTIKLDIYDDDVESVDQKDVANLVNLDGTVYFCAKGAPAETGGYNRELWKTNGTTAGTVRVATFPPNSDRELNTMFILGKIFNEILVILTDYPGADHNYTDLWKTNDISGPQFVKMISQSQAGPLDMVEVDDAIYFRGAHYGIQRTDGTACGTVEITHEVYLSELTLSNGLILMNFHQPSIGEELFVHDPALAEIPCDEITLARSDSVVNYPNPFDREFHVFVKGPQNGSCEALIKDMNGTQVMRLTLDFNTDYVLGATLPPGLYILEIGTTQRISRRIIKSNYRDASSAH